MTPEEVRVWEALYFDETEEHERATLLSDGMQHWLNKQIETGNVSVQGVAMMVSSLLVRLRLAFTADELQSFCIYTLAAVEALVQSDVGLYDAETGEHVSVLTPEEAMEAGYERSAITRVEAPTVVPESWFDDGPSYQG